MSMIHVFSSLSISNIGTTIQIEMTLRHACSPASLLYIRAASPNQKVLNIVKKTCAAEPKKIFQNLQNS